MNREQLLELMPACALGVLDDDERAAVEAWLPTDPEAQRLLDQYREVVDWMALAVPAQPASAHLQADLRRRLAGERRDNTAAETRSAARPRPLLRRRWIPLAAALVTVGVLLALRPGEPAEALYDRLMEQPDASEITIQPDLEPALTGTLVTSRDGTEAVIQVENLPEIGADEAFQLWLVDEAGARSGGLFRFASSQREHYIIIPLEKPVTEYRAFGLSLEPAGGSPYADRPSGPRVFGVEVSA